MSDHNSHFENKIEEVVQLLCVQNELLEKQTMILEEFLARFANFQGEQALNTYLQDAKNGEGDSLF